MFKLDLVFKYLFPLLLQKIAFALHYKPRWRHLVNFKMSRQKSRNDATQSRFRVYVGEVISL